LCLGCPGWIDLPPELMLLESATKPTTSCEFSFGTIYTHQTMNYTGLVMATCYITRLQKLNYSIEIYH
jgi:hypothetical protein